MAGGAIGTKLVAPPAVIEQRGGGGGGSKTFPFPTEEEAIAGAFPHCIFKGFPRSLNRP